MSFQKCNDGYILYICSNKISLIREVYQLKINGLKLIPSFIHLYHNGRQSWNYYKGRSFRSLLNLSCVYWHCSLGSWDSSFSYRIQRYQHVSIKSSMININVLSIPPPFKVWYEYVYIFSEEPNFQGADSRTRIGNSILTIAMLVLSLGFLLCCYACKKVERETNKRTHQGVVYGVSNLFIES